MIGYLKTIRFSQSEVVELSNLRILGEKDKKKKEEILLEWLVHTKPDEKVVRPRNISYEHIHHLALSSIFIYSF